MYRGTLSCLSADVIPVLSPHAEALAKKRARPTYLYCKETSIQPHRRPLVHGLLPRAPPRPAFTVLRHSGDSRAYLLIDLLSAQANGLLRSRALQNARYEKRGPGEHRAMALRVRKGGPVVA